MKHSSWKITIWGCCCVCVCYIFNERYDFSSSLAMRFIKMAVLDTSVWILHQKSTSTEFLLWVALHIRYFFALGRVGAAVVLVVEKALPAWVGGWLWGVTHSDNGGLHSWKRVHAALACYFMPHGPQLKLVVVRNPHKRAPAENLFKAGPKPEPRRE